MPSKIFFSLSSKSSFFMEKRTQCFTMFVNPQFFQMSPLYHVYSVNCIVPNTKNFVSQHLALAYMDFHRTAIRSRKHFILSYVSVLLKIIGSKQKTSNKEIRAVSPSFIIKDRRTLQTF